MGLKRLTAGFVWSDLFENSFLVNISFTQTSEMRGFNHTPDLEKNKNIVFSIFLLQFFQQYKLDIEIRPKFVLACLRYLYLTSLTFFGKY